MNDARIGVALVSGLSLVGLWGLAVWGFRPLLVEKFRQEMFRLRDKMFDEAHEGNLEFQADAYRVLRQTMNGYIRFGHRLNLLTVVLFGGLIRQEGKEWLEKYGFNRRWATLISDLPEGQRESLEAYRSKMEKLVAKQLVFGSPVLVLSIVPVILFLALLELQLRAVQKLRRKWKRSFGDRMDEAALAAGQAG